MNKKIFGILLLIISITFVCGSFVHVGNENVDNKVVTKSVVSIGIPFEDLSLEKQEFIRNKVVQKRPDLKEEDLQNSRYLKRYEIPEINLKNGEKIILK